MFNLSSFYCTTVSSSVPVLAFRLPQVGSVSIHLPVPSGTRLQEPLTLASDWLPQPVSSSPRWNLSSGLPSGSRSSTNTDFLFEKPLEKPRSVVPLAPTIAQQPCAGITSPSMPIQVSLPSFFRITPLSLMGKLPMLYSSMNLPSSVSAAP